MALVRMTEKKLAASRANARKSNGPITPAGKEKVSRNACRHHTYTNKSLIPPVWDARIWDVVNPCAATVKYPVERACLTAYLFHKQWTLVTFAYGTRLLHQSIARQRGFDRGAREFAVNNPRFLQLENRLHTLDRKAEKARIAWERVRRKVSTKGSIPHFIENEPVTLTAKTLTMAAAAGSGAGAGRPQLPHPLPVRIDLTHPVQQQPPRPQDPPPHHRNRWSIPPADESSANNLLRVKKCAGVFLRRIPLVSNRTEARSRKRPRPFVRHYSLGHHWAISSYLRFGSPRGVHGPFASRYWPWWWLTPPREGEYQSMCRKFGAAPGELHLLNQRRDQQAVEDVVVESGRARLAGKR